MSDLKTIKNRLKRLKKIEAIISSKKNPTNDELIKLFCIRDEIDRILSTFEGLD